MLRNLHLQLSRPARLRFQASRAQTRLRITSHILYGLLMLLLIKTLVSNPLAHAQAAEYPVTSTQQATSAINVYYPIVREPYQQIFEHIIEGMVDELSQAPVQHGLHKKSQAPVLNNQNDIIVALGQRGLKAAAEGPQPVVVGAISRPPAHYPKPLYGFALTPSPKLMINKLNELAPQVTDVYVVFNPSRSQWLINDIKAVCEALHIQLHLASADRLASAAKLINRHLQQAQPKVSAIWLLESGFTNDNSLMNQILELAWEKNLVVFSGNPSHIRRGLLFSMYPDNTRLGQALGQMAQDIQMRQQSGNPLETGETNTEPHMEASTAGSSASQGNRVHILPLEHLHTGVNLRTAEHLGIKISREQEFDLVYPPQ